MVLFCCNFCNLLLRSEYHNILTVKEKNRHTPTIFFKIEKCYIAFSNAINIKNVWRQQWIQIKYHLENHKKKLAGKSVYTKCAKK